MESDLRPRDAADHAALVTSAREHGAHEFGRYYRALAEGWRPERAGRTDFHVTVLNWDGARAFLRYLVPEGVTWASEHQWRGVSMCGRDGECETRYVPPSIEPLDSLDGALNARCDPENGGCGACHVLLECRRPVSGRYSKWFALTCDRTFTIIRCGEPRFFATWEEMEEDGDPLPCHDCAKPPEPLPIGERRVG